MVRARNARVAPSLPCGQSRRRPDRGGERHDPEAHRHLGKEREPGRVVLLMPGGPDKARHLAAVRLRSMAAGEFGRWTTRTHASSRSSSCQAAHAALEEGRRGLYSCHSSTGSTHSALPLLEGQPKVAFIAQWRAFRERKRTAPVMANLAEQSSERDANDLAGHTTGPPRGRWLRAGRGRERTDGSHGISTGRCPAAPRRAGFGRGRADRWGRAGGGRGRPAAEAASTAVARQDIERQRAVPVGAEEQSPARGWTWATLMRRAFAVDALE